MSIRSINEAFKRLYEDEQPVPTVDSDLRTALMAEVDRLMFTGGYIKDYEIAFQDVIEKFYPDKAWWEVCDVDIFSHLFMSRSPEETVDAIVNSIEGSVEECLSESPEIKKCPVCGRNFNSAECSKTDNDGVVSCPRCGEHLIKCDSGEYTKYEESFCEGYVDCGGIMGEPGVHYTVADLKAYWDKNKSSDPVLVAYKGNYNNWLKDTVSNMSRMNESVLRRMKSFISRLNEDDMSDEDKHDSDLIRSMIRKIETRSNASFTPEEKEVMKKYGITRVNYKKKLEVDDRELNPEIDTKRGSSFSGKRFSNGTTDKINYADRARKLPARRKNQLAGDGSASFRQNAEINAHSLGYNPSLQKFERGLRDQHMYEPIRDMKGALRDRRSAQNRIDRADAERSRRMADAQAAYDKAKARADWNYDYDTRYSGESRDRAQHTIDKLLKRDK